MIVSHAKNFVFLHNPKAAGTAFRSAIAPWHDHKTNFWGIVHHPYFNSRLDLAHLRAWELPVVAPDVFAVLRTCPSLAFVRDPLPRFLSACAEHFRQFLPRFRFTRLPHAGQRVLIHWLIRSGRIQAGVRGDHRYVHFSPQCWFTHLGEQQIARHIVPIRSGQEDFSSAFTLLGLPPTPAKQENRTQGADWQTLASPLIRRFVDSFYAEDRALLPLT
jgi:hypothetical protein